MFLLTINHFILPVLSGMRNFFLPLIRFRLHNYMNFVVWILIWMFKLLVKIKMKHDWKRHIYLNLPGLRLVINGSNNKINWYTFMKCIKEKMEDMGVLLWARVPTFCQKFRKNWIYRIEADHWQCKVKQEV